MKTDTRKWILFFAWFFMIMLLFAAALSQATPAQAQDTATPIPTADTDYIIELSSGNEVEISRSFTYGQVGIIVALGIVALLLFIMGMFQLFAHYLH